MEERSDELPEEAWREITVAQGSQGPRSYRFSAQRVWPTSRRKPGEIHWAVYPRRMAQRRYQLLLCSPSCDRFQSLSQPPFQGWLYVTSGELVQPRNVNAVPRRSP